MDEMTKGFPRPRKYVHNIRVGEFWKSRGIKFKGWHRRVYPIPYTAQMDRVGHLHADRVNECHDNRLCIVCGIVVKGKPWAYMYYNTLPEDAGPFHEKCMKLTQTLCPVVAEDNGNMFKFIRLTWADLEARVLPEKFIS